LLLFYKPLLLEAQHCLQEKEGEVDITYHRREEAKRARLLVMFIDLDEDGDPIRRACSLDATTPARAATTTRRQSTSPTTMKKRRTRRRRYTGV
jgi:hypothetical protein